MFVENQPKPETLCGDTCLNITLHLLLLLFEKTYSNIAKIIGETRPNIKTFVLNDNSLVSGPVSISYQELESFIEENYVRDPGSRRFVCNICGHSCLNRLDVARHIEAKHVNLPEIYCPHCGKPYKNRNSLRVHIKNTHPDLVSS